MRIVDANARAETEDAARDRVAGAALERNVAGELARTDDQCVRPFCKSLRDAKRVGHQMLSVRVDGHDGLVCGEVLADIRKRRFQRGAFPFVDLMRQERNTVESAYGVKDGAARLAAAVVHDDDPIGRLTGKVRQDAEQLFIRFVCGNDNDHA